MGAKVLVKSDYEAVELNKPVSAASITESMVATEAELRALWAKVDQNVGIGCRAPVKRNGVA